MLTSQRSVWAMGKWTSLGFSGSCLAIALASVSTAAQSVVDDGSKNYGIDFGVSLESRYDDNSLLTPEGSDEDVEGEAQHRAGLTFGFNYASSFSSLVGVYNYFEEYYAKDSQEEAKRLTGTTTFEMASAADTLSLEIEHNRTNVLTTPDASNILENTEERETYTVRPALQGRPSASIQPIVSGVYEKTRYLESRNNNYELKGVQLDLIRHLNANRSIGLRGFTSTNEFEYSPDVDYEYHLLSAVLSSRLRDLNYELSVGKNFQEPKLGEESSGLFYGLDLAYSHAATNVNFSSSQRLTDSSAIGGGLNSVDNTNVGTNLGDLDQVETSSHELGVQHRICDRCSVSLQASYEEVEYRNLIINDSEITLLTLLFSYDFSRSLSGDIQVSERRTDFVNAAENNLDETNFRVALNKTLNSQLRLGFEIRSDVERRFEADTKSNIYAINLSWFAR